MRLHLIASDFEYLATLDLYIRVFTNAFICGYIRVFTYVFICGYVRVFTYVFIF